MKLVRGAWKLLVGIKDALVLFAMLLFFGLIFAALNARPNPAAIRDGALVLDLDGSIVEQPEQVQALAILSGRDGPRQFRLRDVVRAIDAARDDARVKAVVLDLDGFSGGYPAALNEVGEALARVRAAKKPVLTYASGYTDAGYRLAANASEVWMHPMGQTLFTGPGGTTLYYKGLIDRLGVNVHVYRVGRYKSFVEPYTRADQSPDARAAAQALYGSLFENWKQSIAKARPKAQTARWLGDAAGVATAAQGDFAKAALDTGLVDRLGDRIAFGQRVAALAGVDTGKPAGAFNRIAYDDFLGAHPMPTTGDAVGIITVAGDIVDGTAGPGTAGGDTVVQLLLKGMADNNLKALVVRVDSPGGSALASEEIRQAVLQAKAKGLPVVVSMGSIAASGGYWVSTAGDAIFAEPSTITGSIGIFGIVPTFEKALAKIGLTSDGVRTTPLSGQPDVMAGTTPEVDTLFQAGIEHGYRQFIGRVAAARHMTPDRVDQIGQGRVWDGGTARQIGLVDRFGTLSDAVAEAARRAKLDPGKVHAEYLEKKPGTLDQFIAALRKRNDDGDDAAGGDAFTRLATMRRDALVTAVGDARRLATGAAVQARCLECGGLGPARADAADRTLVAALLARLGF
ncbi:protease-4 [Sphingomonas gellani]|uniref:Protease-4 n=1 Tax=Sphingomonas gellani TaxID=1166340 RepID=A0A1H8G1M3_9SPHN|nr:signal peptide peptidase SppA [Sphingomonas gellani]SEN37407.1 protease-4 [Sphingomonas gellani]